MKEGDNPSKKRHNQEMRSVFFLHICGCVCCFSRSTKSVCCSLDIDVDDSNEDNSNNIVKNTNFITHHTYGTVRSLNSPHICIKFLSKREISQSVVGVF